LLTTNWMRMTAKAIRSARHRDPQVQRHRHSRFRDLHRSGPPPNASPKTMIPAMTSNLQRAVRPRHSPSPALLRSARPAPSMTKRTRVRTTGNRAASAHQARVRHHSVAGHRQRDLAHDHLRLLALQGVHVRRRSVVVPAAAVDWRAVSADPHARRRDVMRMHCDQKTTKTMTTRMMIWTTTSPATRTSKIRPD
jgi:hypothetical protein